MDVLLINPPWKRPRLRICFPSLGLGYLAAMLEKNGKSVKILDATAQGVALEGLEQYLKDLETVPRYIGITATTTEANIALEVAQICKNVMPGVNVVLGGVHATVMPEAILANKNVILLSGGKGNILF